MALQAIRPEYKSWVDSKTDTPISEIFDGLEKQFDKLNQTILQGKESDKQISRDVSDARTKLLYTSLIYSQRKMKDPNTDWTNYNVVFKRLQDNIEYIASYEAANLLRQQKSSINVLTWVSTICLPLSLIVGYYGMNFGSMGVPSKHTGPFAMRHGQLWILFLFGTATLFTLGLLILTHKLRLPGT